MDKDNYLNRELSWLRFNERVLEEAADKTNPLLERLNFLAITSSNLDEFFMVRVASLINRMELGYNFPDPCGLTPEDTLKKISGAVHEMTAKQYSLFSRSIMPALEKENIFFRKYKDLNEEQREFIRRYFKTTVFPILTPMAIDSSRPFPLLNNKALLYLVELESQEEEKEESIFAIMQVPTVIPRIVELPASGADREFIMLEIIIKKYISELFDGFKVLKSALFRITRSSDYELDEFDAPDLMHEVERKIKSSKWGKPIRLEAEKSMSKNSARFLKEELELNDGEIYEIPSILDFTVWFSFLKFKGFDRLKNESLRPVPSPAFREGNMFDVIKERDILVHHPYESFECVTDLIYLAAADPDVLAIKQTLYRVSGQSPVISALMEAAEKGKQVTVIVELKARFDEENNINWARKLEQAGCHVVYGLLGLKTHIKALLIVRREELGIRRYVHMSTGNYNDSTARLYTDIGFFTCKESFAQDISALFNLLTGYSKNNMWNKIAVAPTGLRQMFMAEIEKEEKNAKAGKPARIIAKVNSLVDEYIIEALYKASKAGVKIRLIVRGICCLRAGVAGLSDNISVVSIVDRFLEHSRVYYFENGGEPKLYLSSADLMPRNLDRRVEAAFPIENEELKNELMEILNLSLSDTVKLRYMKPDGAYEKIDKRGKELVRSQMVFHERAREKYSNSKEIK